MFTFLLPFTLLLESVFLPQLLYMLTFLFKVVLLPPAHACSRCFLRTCSSSQLHAFISAEDCSPHRTCLLTLLLEFVLLAYCNYMFTFLPKIVLLHMPVHVAHGLTFTSFAFSLHTFLIGQSRVTLLLLCKSNLRYSMKIHYKKQYFNNRRLSRCCVRVIFQRDRRAPLKVNDGK